MSKRPGQWGNRWEAGPQGGPVAVRRRAGAREAAVRARPSRVRGRGNQIRGVTGAAGRGTRPRTEPTFEHYSRWSRVEPMTGIEPAYSAWEADVLPLNYIGMAALIWGTPLSESGTEAQCHTMSQLDPNSLRRPAVQRTGCEHTAASSGWRPCGRTTTTNRSSDELPQLKEVQELTGLRQCGLPGVAVQVALGHRHYYHFHHPR
jgi:hypothetical protein